MKTSPVARKSSPQPVPHAFVCVGVLSVMTACALAAKNNLVRANANSSLETLPADAQVVATAPDASANAIPPVVVEDTSAFELVLANANGIHVIGYDGVIRRTLTTQTSRWVRQAKEQVVFLSDAGDVFVVPMNGQTPARMLATLPRNVGVGCGVMPRRPYDPMTGLRDVSSMIVAEDNPVLCLSVAPTGGSSIHLSVNLTTGAVHGYALETCGAPNRGVPRGLIGEEAMLCATEMDYGSSAGQTTLKRLDCPPGAKRREDGMEVSDTDWFSLNDRWRYFKAKDSPDSPILIVDQLSRQVFDPVPGAWPAPLHGDALRAFEATQPGRGEYDGTLCWLPGNVLLTPKLIVVPGLRTVSFEGVIAR